MRSRLLNSLLGVMLAGLIVLFFGMILVPGIEENVRVGRFDFIVLYTGGHILKQGHAKHLYDYDTQRQVQLNLTGRLTPLPFNHTPYEALLFVPLACFPYLWAYWIWALINFGLLALCAYLLRDYLGNIRNLALRLVLVLSVIAPVFLAIVHGQDSILMLFLFTLAFVSLKQGREVRAGCCLALALLKCQFVLPFVPVFFVKRRWSTVSAFLAVSMLLVLVSFWVIGWSGLADWAHLTGQQNAAAALSTAKADMIVSFFGMPNLRGFFYAALAGRMSPFGLNLLLAICSVALVVWGVWRWGPGYESQAADYGLLLGLTLVVAFLVSYYAWPHDLVLMGLPVVLTFRSFETTGTLSPRRLIFIGLTALLFIVPLGLFIANQKHFWLLSWVLLALLLTLSAEIRHVREGE